MSVPDPSSLPQLPPQLKGVLDAALDCIITIDSQGRIIEFNSAAERTFGHRRADVLGREMAEVIVPPAMRDRHRRGLDHMVSTGQGKGMVGRRIEVNAMRADGTEFPVELTITKVEVGSEVFFTAYLREDIVARLQTRFTAILDSALDCIITIDHLGRIVDFNAAASRTFGHSREQAVGREMSDLIVPPAMRERHRAGLRRLVETGQGAGIVGHRIEITALHADGHEFPVELAITQVDSTGKQPFFTAYLRDLSDRRRAELTQRESQNYFEKSFAANPALMSIADATTGKILEVNPAFIRACGYSREEIVGRTTLELGFWVHPEQRDRFIERIRADGHIRDLEAEFRTKSGPIRSLLINADVIELGGKPCMLTVGIDVSERVRRDKVQSAIYAISQAVLSRDELPVLLEKLHRIIAELMPAKNFYVALLNQDRTLLSFPYFIDETTPRPATRPPRKGLTEYVMDTGQPLRATNLEIIALVGQRGQYTPTGNPSAQWLGAPLVVQGRSIGVITVQDYQNPNAYNDEDQRLLMFVASQTAAAIHHQQVEASQREVRAQFEKSFHLNPAFMMISRADNGQVIEVNPAFTRSVGYSREETVGRTTLELNLWVDPREREEMFRGLERDGVIRNVEARLRHKSGRTTTLIFNADLIELNGQSCLLSVGIDISERRRRDQVQAATYEISQAVLGGDELPKLLAKVHSIIGRLMPAKNCYVALLSADRSQISFPYFVDEKMPPIAPRALRNGITEYVIETGQPLLADDAEILARLRTRPGPIPEGYVTAQWLGAPLLIDGRGIGAIAVQDYQNPEAYTEEDKRLLVFVAEQTAAAVHRQQVEAAQREARTYFEKSFHASPALMVINRAADRVITEANPAFLRICGYTREELIGRGPDEINLWVHAEQRATYLRSILERGAVRDLEADFRAKSGEIGTFLVNADVIELGGTRSILTVGFNISDRRRRERVQNATFAIAQAVLAGGDLPALFAEVHRIVGELFPAKNLYVALLNADRTLVSFPYYVDELTPAPAPRKPGFGLTEYVLNTARPLRTSADEPTVVVHESGRYQPIGKSAALWLGAPLVIEGRAIGAIVVQDYHNAHAYTDDDLQLLLFVANQTAGAVHRQQVEAAQKEARAYFEKSFHASPALMSIAHADNGAIIEANPAFLSTSGYTREEVIGRTTVDLLLWQNPAEREKFINPIRATGAIRNFSAEFRTKAGASRTLILNADLIELGGTPCVLTVGIDITERRRHERVQAATYAISQLVLGDGDLPALFAGVHRIIAGLMPAENLYVALVSDDGRQQTFPYFVDAHIPPPETRTTQNGFTDYVLEVGHPVLATSPELEVILRARGPYTPPEIPPAQRLGAPLLIGGRAVGVIALQDYHNPRAYGPDEVQLLGFVAEQTAATIQRHRAEAARARAEARYRSIFENAVEGLYVSSPEGKFLSANPAFAHMLGFSSPSELLAAIEDIQHQFYVQKNRREEFYTLVAHSDEVTDFESEIYRKDGSTLWISESVRVVRTPQGKIDHFEGVTTDITQRREAARALQAAKEAADAASRAKSYFLASVSHELRTPLNGILGYTQILRRDSTLTEKQREGVHVIHESADHLLALINDVLDLSKIEAGRIELHPADFDLPEFAAGVERVFMPRAREKSILFESALSAELPRWVHGDEQRLRQVVFNLVSNAVKFTKAGGVVFSVQPLADGAIRFSVSDTGPGIAPEDIGKLFEPFTQVGKEAGAASGTGLGLAISRSLVERMGSRLNLESKPGWGSRFWFDVWLPRAAAAPAASTTTRRVVGYEGRRRKVLVVDDNAANRSVMIDMLAPLGFDLAESADGRGALTEEERFRPDLVLMDLRLPGEFDGLEATRRIRARAATRTSTGEPPLRIIAVSASAYDLDRTECFAAGCDDFLAKPFREEALWAIVARALGLTWQTTDPEESRSPFPVVVQAPPAAEAAAIYDLAAKGDVVGIRARAQALIAQNAKYAPFAQGVLDLASRFKMKAVRTFVSRYMSSSPDV